MPPRGHLHRGARRCAVEVHGHSGRQCGEADPCVGVGRHGDGRRGERANPGSANVDGEGWWATYEEFDACPRCVCNVVGQLVAFAAGALSTSSECHADNCVVCAAEDGREPPRAVDDITRRLAFLLDFIQKPPP
jgi:hypothetical protein